MPSFDDRSGFPPLRRRRSDIAQSGAARDARGQGAKDWRYPDPAERYAQDYDDFGTPPAQNREADEWQRRTDPDRRRHGFDDADWREPPPEDRGWRGSEPAWREEDAAGDPFDWDAPEPPSDNGWRDDAFSHEVDDGVGPGHEHPGGRAGWDDGALDRPGPSRLTDPRPNGQPLRDDSLLLRIGGGTKPEAAPLPRGAAEDPFAADRYQGDPTALSDRFFSRAEGFGDDDEPPARSGREREAPAASNVFQFDPYRDGARQGEPDDPYAWGEQGYDDEREALTSVLPQAAAYEDYDDEVEIDVDDGPDADFLDDEPERLADPVAPRQSNRKLMVAGVLMTAVVTGGGAAFLYKGYQDGSLANLEAPTLLADSGPVKGQPSDPGGRTFPDGNKQIYDRLSGGPAQPATQPRETARAESASIPGIVTTGVEAPADTLDERIAQALRRSGSPAGDTAGATTGDADAPRTVRTLTVRPDGSVVPVVETPREPSPEQTLTTAGIIATTGGAQEAARRDAPAAEQTASTQPAAAPRPERAAPRPQETRVVSAEPVSAPTTQPRTASTEPYFVQLAARRDQTSALAAFADLQQKYPGILSGLAPTIKKADLGDKGVWYRLWVGPMPSRNNAQDVCGKLKTAGLNNCFVRTE